MIYSHMYPSTYAINAQMILPGNVLVHIRDVNNYHVRSWLLQGYRLCAQEKINYNIYTSTYDVCVHMLLSKHVLLHIQVKNNDLILLPYV